MLCTHLKEQREKAGLTQVELAKRLNITERQYQRLEAGDSWPRFKTLIALADFFAVSIDYLVGRTDNPQVNR